MFYDFITKYTDIFVKKGKPLQCKSFSYFSTKNTGIFQILTFEILTKRKLTTSLVLNYRAQVSKICLYISSSSPRLMPAVTTFPPFLLLAQPGDPYTNSV